MGQLEDYYLLVKDEHPEVSKRHSDHLTSSLLDLDEVKWANQQKRIKIVWHAVGNSIEEQEEELIKYMKKEVKLMSTQPSGSMCKKSIFSCIRFPFSFRSLFVSITDSHQKRLRQGNVSSLGKFSTRPAPHSQLSKYKGPTKNIELLTQKISAYEVYFNDPLWTKQWHAQDYRTTNMPVMDHNLVPVYKMGYTGKGITVAVVDSPIQHDHPDLLDTIVARRYINVGHVNGQPESMNRHSAFNWKHPLMEIHQSSPMGGYTICEAYQKYIAEKLERK